MRSATLLAIAGLSLIAFVGFALSVGSGAHAQATTTIQVGDFWFCDPGDTACMVTDTNDIDVDSQINVGDGIVWDYASGGSLHTVTQCSDASFSTCPPTGGFDSGTLNVGDTFPTTPMIFDQAGTFYYKCTIHPGTMRGAITVLAAEPTPTSTPSPTLTPTLTPTPQPSPGPSPQPKPQPSPQVLSEGATPSAGPAPVDVQPATVPAGGGEPPSDGGASVLWWWALAAGGLLVATAAFALRRLRR